MNLNRPGRRLILLLLATFAVLAFTFWSFAHIPTDLDRGQPYLSPYIDDPDSQEDLLSRPSTIHHESAEEAEEEEDSDEGAEQESQEGEGDSDYDGYKAHTPAKAPAPHTGLGVDPKVLTGTTIAPKLGNETAKAELGRAAWKLFHTTFARFPDKPNDDEQEALRAWVLLFTRLYPCGECAGHFQSILQKFPPQVTSRSAAAAWGCHVHNQVNESLDKEPFDCSNIGDFYDCGCADDDENDIKSSGKETLLWNSGLKDPKNKGDANIPEDEREPVQLEKEGLQKGG